MKNNIKKTILTLIAIITLMSTVAVLPTYAALPNTGGTVEPMWDNIAMTSTNVLFTDDLYGAADIAVTGKAGTTKTTINIKVFKQIGNAWIIIQEGTKHSNAMVTAYEVLFPGQIGCYYKIIYTISVTRFMTTETITETRYITCE